MKVRVYFDGKRYFAISISRLRASLKLESQTQWNKHWKISQRKIICGPIHLFVHFFRSDVQSLPTTLCVSYWVTISWWRRIRWLLNSSWLSYWGKIGMNWLLLTNIGEVWSSYWWWSLTEMYECLNFWWTWTLVRISAIFFSFSFNSSSLLKFFLNKDI